MNKTKQLARLFEEWKKEQSNESEKSCLETMIRPEERGCITKECFCEDGIIDERQFNKQNIKVLFISNEANDAAYNNGELTSRIKSFNHFYETGKDDFGVQMMERICCLYQVISDNYQTPINIVARDFAFMNLNKRGGAERVNDNHIEKYCVCYNGKIQDEISIIDPNLIVWLGCNTFYLAGKNTDSKKENGVLYFNLNGKKVPVIRMWHPCYYQAKKKYEEKTPFDFGNAITNRHAGKLKGELTEIVMELVKKQQSKR